MENQSNRLPKIGYLFYYPKLDKSSDRFQLDVYISAVPTEKHFDVKHATFLEITSDNGIEPVTIKHPWNFEKNAQICAGLIVLEDRKGKKVEAFSFGGRLTIVTKEDQTACTLISDAPILEISAAPPSHKMFIDEVEIILAKYRAEFPRPQDFEQKMCETDAFTLYLACLEELIPYIEDFSQKDDTYLNLLGYLHSQIHRLEAAGLLKGYHKNLERIFRTA